MTKIFLWVVGGVLSSIFWASLFDGFPAIALVVVTGLLAAGGAVFSWLDS